MPPLPKRKYPKARQGDRRRHLHARLVTIRECPNCHKARVAHRACPHCGFYKGVEVVKQETSTKKGS